MKAMDVGPSSTAFALSSFPYTNPSAMQFPATAAPASAIPGASISGNYFPFPNSNPNVYESPSSDLLQQQHNQQYLNVGGTRKMRKRKAESQDNERLSKRLSLLNLGRFSIIYLSSTNYSQCIVTNTISFDRKKWAEALRPSREPQAQAG